MMKIPGSQQPQGGDQVQGPPEPFVLMAAATMHKMGRLVAPTEEEEFADTVKGINAMAPGGINPETMRRSDNVEDVRGTIRPMVARAKQTMQEALHGEQQEPLLDRPEDIERSKSQSKLSKAGGIDDIDAAMKLDLKARVARIPKERRDQILKDAGLKVIE